MLLMMGVFLFNLLCGLVPCDMKFDLPQISQIPLKEIKFRDGRPENKLDIPAKVTVIGGKIEGYHMQAAGGRSIFAFEGIPYGSSLRWQPPVPREPWIGTLQTKSPGSDCLQLSLAKFLRVYGNEDCLFVNVFTPDLPYKGNNPKYPVVIYFHGGSFAMGSGSEHGPAYLLNENVVLITVNYRLGVFGFLSTGDIEISGNWGLKDQALAIEWVHENIDQFGGDPDNINLWGYSAGGVAVQLHMMSNKTRHLFTKGISNGGTAFLHWGVQKPWRARYYTNRLAKRVGCPTDNSKALKDCLYKVPPNTLATNQLNLFDWFPFPATLFSPTIEPEHPDAFLTESPEDAYALGHVAKKPWILTTTKEEGLTGVLVLQLLFRWLPMRLSWQNSARSYLDFGYIAENTEEITEKISQYYFGNKSTVTVSPFDFAKPLTDRYFHTGIRKGLQAHSEIAPTYSYLYSFKKGKYSMGNLFGHKAFEWGPGHGEDDYYLFNCSTQYQGFKQTDPDYKISRVMINLMANFVTTGKPFYINDEGEKLEVWEPVTNGSDIRMLQIDQEVKMVSMPNQERLDFWMSLGLKDTVPWVSGIKHNISNPISHNEIS